MEHLNDSYVFEDEKVEGNSSGFESGERGGGG